jgi:NitT/TauT family transport system permease protein
MGRAERRIAWAATYRLIGLAGFIAAWSVAAYVAGPGPLLPSPLRVAAFLWREAADGELLHQLTATLARVVAAFVLAMTAGSVAGYLMGRSARLDALVDPVLVIALNLPLLVVVVLAYIWIGLNDVAAVAAVVAAKAPTVAVTIREGVRALDVGLDEMAVTFRLPWLRRLRAVVLPQLAPYFAVAGRSGLSITWKIVLVVELLGRPDGVGFAINLAFQSFNVTGIIGYGLAFAAIMLIAEVALLQPLERRAGRWRNA